jgi:hypothetical protein
LRLFDARQKLTATRMIKRELSPQELAMLDLLMIALGLVFFALSVGYTIACDRL